MRDERPLAAQLEGSQMGDDAILRLTREALLLVLVVSGPPVLVSMMVGLLVSVFQATTQIQEQTLTFVPKALAIVGILVLLLPWIVRSLIEFTTAVIEKIPQMVN